MLSRHADYIHTYMRTELGDSVQGDGNFVQLPRNSLCSHHRVSVEYLCFHVFYRPNHLKGLSDISRITGPSCPEGSRKLRFPDYVTMTQCGGKVVSLTRRPLLPSGNTPGTHFC